MSPLKTVVFLCGLLAVASLVSASVANDEFVFAEMVESTSAGDRAMMPATIDPAFAPAAMASPYSGYFPRMMEQVPAGAAAPAAPAAAAPAAGAVPRPNPDAPATAAYAYYNYPYSTAPPVPPPMPTYLPLPPYVPSAEVLSLGV